MNTALLGQSLISGILSGGIYTLMGLGLTLTWRFLRIINLSQFALIFFSAYAAYELVGRQGIPIYAVVPMVAIGCIGWAIVQQFVLQRFGIKEFSSVLATFGIVVISESLIQWKWSADLVRMESGLSTQSLIIGPFFLPVVETVALVAAVLLALATHLWLHHTLYGKALRASSENASIAAAFGVPDQKLSYLVAAASGVFAAITGTFVALIFTLAPSEIYTWFGVTFATVLIGGLGNPLGLLGASLMIGVLESGTMTVASPTLAPLVSFSILILILVFWPERL